MTIKQNSVLHHVFPAHVPPRSPAKKISTNNLFIFNSTFSDVFPQLCALAGTDNRTGTTGRRRVTPPQCCQAELLLRDRLQGTVQQADLLPAGSDMRRLLLVVPRAADSVLLQVSFSHSITLSQTEKKIFAGFGIITNNFHQAA